MGQDEHRKETEAEKPVTGGKAERGVLRAEGRDRIEEALSKVSNGKCQLDHRPLGTSARSFCGIFYGIRSQLTLG